MAKVRTCPECGTKFTPIKSQVCCCTRCKEARHRRQMHDYYEQHRIIKPKPKPQLTPEAKRN